MAPLRHHLIILLLLVLTAATTTSSSTTTNPFTPKSAFLRYYARKVPRNRPLPSFLLSKLSPLSGPAAAASSIPTSPSLLSSFCAAANLLCPSTAASTASHPPSPSDFASYGDTNFSNYGTSLSGGHDTFKQYSPDANLPVDSFRRYSHSSTGRLDSFSSYASDGNVVTANFTSYAGSAVSGSGSFSSYAAEANVPDLKFTNYDNSAVDRSRSFSSYSDSANSGSQDFAGYGKHGNGLPTAFASYATGANTFGSTFSGYGESGNDGADNFTSYGGDTNEPVNDFKSYRDGSNGGKESFKSYRDKANTGEDSFRSYAEHGNGASAEFENYGRSFNPGSDSFQGYGVGSTSAHDVAGFRGYSGENTTFKSYAKVGVTFAAYKNRSSSSPSLSPGKFFRESSLKSMSTMTMADIRDKSPNRSFLPRSIAGKLPFSAAELGKIFRVPKDTALGKAMASAVAECGRAPSRGETKKCVASAEDMIDFAVSVLGNNVVVRATDNVRGSGTEVVIGSVTGINGGKVTESVSCHQSLFPYLLYYCHSVPMVRVYEAEILDAATEEKINRGVAICHLDTSDWSPTHGAFVALGSKPGEIEVCHWIFEGDMTWTVAD